LEKREPIAYITFNRPERLNALRPPDYLLLLDYVNDLERDDKIRAVIVTGKGRGWLCGDDLMTYPNGPEYEATVDHETSALYENRLQEALMGGYSVPQAKIATSFLESGKVWIAAVNGICWLPDFLYAMDFVIAADVATIGQGDVRMGCLPGACSTQIAPMVLGRRRALEIILTSDAFSAQDAYRIGLVNKVVPLAQLMPEAEALAKKVSAYPTNGIKLVKMAMTLGHDLPLKHGLAMEQLIMGVSTSQGETFKNYAQKYLAQKKARKGK
jgi:enoyl-CoA hydratase